MKKRFFLCLFTLSLWNIGIMHAQLDISFQNTEPQTPTWKTYEIMRYGKVGSSLYTGTVNYSIPVYTYKDHDFEIPISFDYASNGFKANSRAGALGHDWLLNAGGIITREIKGVPDDKTLSLVSTQGTGLDIKGFAWVYSDNISESSVEPQVGLSTSDNLIFYNEIDAHNHYDSEPDIFHFNFLGYSGSFHFWYDHTIKLFNTTGASSALKIEYYNKYFTIITPDGYKYIFTDFNGEYIPGKGSASNIETIISWRLNSIIAPNGRHVYFYYGSPVRNYKYVPATNYYEAMWDGNDTSTYTKEAMLVNTSNVVSFPLDSIVITGNTTIQFMYDAFQKEKYINDHQLQVVNGETSLMKKIEIIHNDSIIKECEINYKYPKMNSSLAVGNITPFLGEIKISGEGVYSFNYYGLEDKYFPYLGSFSFDHWGYYNGKNDSTTPEDFTEYLRYDSIYNETLSTSLKNPDSNFSIIGTLQRISYPTGGFSELTYEPHDYSAKIIRNSQNQFSPKLVSLTNNEITGGIRIKKIVNYSSEGIKSDSLTYTYRNVTNDNLSSGILINVPRYGAKYKAYFGGAQKIVNFYSSNNDIYDYNKTHIEYSHVTETKSDNSKIDYRFTTWQNYPDTLSYNDDSNQNKFGIPTYCEHIAPDPGGGEMKYYTFYWYVVTNHPKYLSNILTPLTSFQSKRGQLWYKGIRSAGGNLIKEETTKYNFPIVSQIYSPKIVAETWRKVYSEQINSQIAGTSMNEYEGSDPVNKNTRYIYNAKGQIISSNTMTSSGDTLITGYTYINDLIPVPTSGVYKNMLDNNVVKYPLQESTSLKRGNVLKHISSKRYTYINPNATNLTLISLSKEEKWNQDDTWTTTEKYACDTLGNVREAENETGMYTTYLWSYGGQYLIAKVENANYSAVNTALSSVGLVSGDNLSAMKNPGNDIISKLKNLESKLPGAFVYLYKQSPLVGLVQTVAPNKLTSQYNYDCWGRLTNIENHELKQTNYYKYNITTLKNLTADLSVLSNYTAAIQPFTVTASGGSGQYAYSWILKNSNGSVLYSTTTSVPTVSITLSQRGTMSLTCMVKDLRTKEEIDCVKTFTVSAVPIEFTNIEETRDVNTGHYTKEGYLNCTEAISMSFTTEYKTSGQFKIHIGKSTYTPTKGQTFTTTIPAGSTLVKMEVSNAMAETEASICITSAGGYSIGSNSCLNFYTE